MTTILVVEDEFAVAELLRDTLADEGYTVLVCGDGRAALEALATGRVHLILSDVMMPRMDGRALVHALRADPRHRATPVILMSAGRGGSLDPARDGFDAYITKPFNLNELLTTVAELLARRPPAAGP